MSRYSKTINQYLITQQLCVRLFRSQGHFHEKSYDLLPMDKYFIFLNNFESLTWSNTYRAKISAVTNKMLIGHWKKSENLNARLDDCIRIKYTDYELKGSGTHLPNIIYRTVDQQVSLACCTMKITQQKMKTHTAQKR